MTSSPLLSALAPGPATPPITPRKEGEVVSDTSRPGVSSGTFDPFELSTYSPPGSESAAGSSDAASVTGPDDELASNSGLAQSVLVTADVPVKGISENPFDNQQSRILFNAIDELQSWGSSKFLKIPQLVIVGGQSSGKSSLLQSLTDIPFPVGAGCCTRFPIRVVSRRTEPGSEDGFRITVEEPEEDIPGLSVADERALEYESSGRVLTDAKFQEVLNDLSYNYIGIREGVGSDKRNFVSNVVKVELSGPARAPFSILDLPGLVMSAHAINKNEVDGVEAMIVKYMQRKENIIVYVVTANADLYTQPMHYKALNIVQDQSRLIGAFTKCDVVTDINEVIKTATGQKVEGEKILEKGFFVVRNRRGGEDSSSDLNESEDELFSTAPWTEIPTQRRGTAMLKKHLAGLLSSRIADDFPSLEESIKKQLAARVSEQARLGESRDSHASKLAFINQYAQRFWEKASLALSRPGILQCSQYELRQQVKKLNDEFDQVMRLAGATWDFEDASVDPHPKLHQYAALLNDTEMDDRARRKIEDEIMNVVIHESDDGIHPSPPALRNIEAFQSHKVVKSVQQFQEEICLNLEGFQASQPPSVINSEVYPVIYRLQVQKWASIAEEHLERTRIAVRDSFEGILQSVCPENGSTAVLHLALKLRLEDMFNHTFNDAMERIREYCKQEAGRTMLQTTDPRYKSQLDGWRALRYVRSFLGFQRTGVLQKGSKRFETMYELMGNHGTHAMCSGIHDVVKVYYEICIESFIRHINQTIIENFVMHQNGPLRGLTTEYVLGLSPEEVQQMAKEDEATVNRREELKFDIEKLSAAQKTAQQARFQMKQAGST